MVQKKKLFQQSANIVHLKTLNWYLMAPDSKQKDTHFRPPNSNKYSARKRAFPTCVIKVRDVKPPSLKIKIAKQYIKGKNIDMQVLGNYQCECTQKCFITYGDRVYRNIDKVESDGDYDMF